ncbi:MAG TPA: MFS transporter [Candidatus Limiplasma sp.]|nr:MFS transporter [Candidatus Limiplasma sp.]
MKLNTRRTILVGLAFMSIGAFWQLYDNVIPLVLKNTFGMKDGAAGIIMALDNILALFLLPFFGALSDRTKTKFGRRTPYIVLGTLCAVVLMNLLPFADNTNNFTLFIIALAFLLVAMGTYRSPAVALMPDVTPKPLRSKGNAIINLMGACGGIFTLVATMFLVKKREVIQSDGVTAAMNDYTFLFIAVATLMVIAIIVLLFKIRENKLAAETAAFNDAYDAENEEPETPEEKAALQGKGGLAALAPDVRKSLFLILSSIFFWFMGYNAVTTAFTKYAQERWAYGIEDASMCLMVATGAAILSFIPVGLFASKYGRKRTIQFGVILLALCFAAFGFYHAFHFTLYIIFALVGVAWASINVNSYPMVVEISKSGDVGQFTGYYYTFSMAAQIITPILSGYLMQYIGYGILAPYAAIMVAISLFTISMAKHGDSRPIPPKSKLEAYDAGDD